MEPTPLILCAMRIVCYDSLQFASRRNEMTTTMSISAASFTYSKDMVLHANVTFLEILGHIPQ